MIEKTYKSKEQLATIIEDMEAQGFVLAEYHGVDIVRFYDAEEGTVVKREAALHELRASDKAMARGVEDLYQAMIDKGLIESADLPESFRAKVARRQMLRGRL